MYLKQPRQMRAKRRLAFDGSSSPRSCAEQLGTTERAIAMIEKDYGHA